MSEPTGDPGVALEDLAVGARYDVWWAHHFCTESAGWHSHSATDVELTGRRVDGVTTQLSFGSGAGNFMLVLADEDQVRFEHPAVKE